MPTLELQMIVKNGASTLARCLQSVKGIADLVTVADTGSTDDTVSIASHHGATVLHIPWHNDFAHARNQVLAHARADWVLFLDADELLDPEAAQQLPALLADPSIHAYDLTAWNYVNDPGFRSSGEQARPNPKPIAPAPAYFPSTNTRLFRTLPGVYFEHCVHETVADRIAALGLVRQHCPCLIHHFGYVEDQPATRAQKETLYFDLALKKAHESPHTYQANLGAGIAHLDHANDPAHALPFFEKALALDRSQPTPWLYTGIALTRLGRATQALKHLNQARAIDPMNPLIATSLGDLYLQANDPTQSLHFYQQATTLGDQSPLTLAKQGAAEVRQGHHETGLARIRQAVEQAPQTPELYDLYATAAFLAGDPSAACEAASHRLTLPRVTAFNFLVAVTLHRHSRGDAEAGGNAGNDRSAEAILEAGLTLFPHDFELNQMKQALQPA